GKSCEHRLCSAHHLRPRRSAFVGQYIAVTAADDKFYDSLIESHDEDKSRHVEEQLDCLKHFQRTVRQAAIKVINKHDDAPLFIFADKFRKGFVQGVETRVIE